MGKPACSEKEFIDLFRQLGPTKAAQSLGISVRNVHERRRRIETNQQIQLESPTAAGGVPKSKNIVYASSYPKRLPIQIDNGVAIIGSDAHYWPDLVSTAHRGFVKLIGELKPKLVCLNGDVFDGARISRHARIGWQQTPTVKQEIEAVEQRLTEIEQASQNATRIWTIGNHCSRIENYLSANTPEMEAVKGFTLKDQFPKWDHCVSVWVNDDVVIKHRFKGGIHAAHNNTLNAGKTIVTGHLHSLKVTPFDDYNGTRYGVDTGTLMDPYGPQAEYTEDNPLNHRSGFVVLTFHKGILLHPEIVKVIGEDAIEFRGQVINL